MIPEFSTLDDLMRHTFEVVTKEGKPISPSRGKAKEVLSAAFRLTNPRARLSRTEGKGTAFSCLGEFLWYLSGSACPEFIGYYVPSYAKEAGPLVDGEVPAAYGPRLFGRTKPNQVERIVDLLKKKPDSRRAVIVLLHPKDLSEAGELPCTNTLQFFLRNGSLSMQTNMRSNDVYSGLPHDVFAFTMLQEIVASKLGAELGVYNHVVGSLHLYDKDLEKARSYLDEGFQSTQKAMPRMPTSAYDDLSAIREIEDEIRRGVRKNLDGVRLGQYWLDVCRLLLAYRAYRDGDMRKLETLKSEINDPTYRTFFEKKLAQHERRQRSGL